MIEQFEYDSDHETIDYNDDDEEEGDDAKSTEISSIASSIASDDYELYELFNPDEDMMQVEEDGWNIVSMEIDG